MQHQEIVYQHLQGPFRTDADQSMARQPPQAAMFFQGREHQLDRLLPQPVDRLSACGLHPGLMRKDELFVFAPPQTTTGFAAGRPLRPERARLARGGLDPVAQFLAVCRRSKGVDNLSMPLYSLSTPWHTRATHAAPRERGARFSHPGVLMEL